MLAVALKGDKVKKTIAWIEDDIDELNPIMEPLIEVGFAFKKIRTYLQAIENIDALRKCDLIILDLILPSGKNTDTDDYLGIDLLRRLRKEFRVNVPILIFSVVAHASDILSEDEQKKLNARSLAKPIRQEQLVEEVYEMLGLQPEGSKEWTA